MHGAHSCLVPVNYFLASIFDQLQSNGKPSTLVRAADFRHLLLLLPFVLDNLLREEVDKYNQGRASGSAVLVDPSEELVMVAKSMPINSFLGINCFVAKKSSKYCPRCADSHITGRKTFGFISHCLSIQEQGGATDHGHRKDSLH